MPEDLISKFNLKRLSLLSTLTQEEIEDLGDFEDSEVYRFPMPDRECNCWFQIFPDTHLINPNKMIFSAGLPDPAAFSVTLQELWNRSLEEMQRYITVECKRFQHEETRKAQLN
jgi:hypothetical protein